MKGKTRTSVSMAVKLDMTKAYDKVEWGFLRRVMEKMGFRGCWIDTDMHVSKPPQQWRSQGSNHGVSNNTI